VTLLLTGGSSLISQHLAEVWLKQGHKVVITHSTQETLEKNLLAVPHYAACDHFVFHFEKKDTYHNALHFFERSENLWGLILLAHPKQDSNQKFSQTALEDFSRHVDSVLKGNTFLLQNALRSFEKRGQGRVVYVSSASCEHGLPGYSAYVAAKLAMEGIIRAVALEHGAQNILSNILRLGVINTERNKHLNERPGYQRLMEKQIPMGRMGEPKDLVPFFDALLSRNSYANGSVITLAGGVPGVGSQMTSKVTQ
jgi:NAD(P)-dependent dehydrogenase (short-subunit alcohol dehydrogenase family)